MIFYRRFVLLGAIICTTILLCNVVVASEKNKSKHSPKEIASWQQINVPAHMQIIDDDGNEKEIFPGCAFGYNPADPSQPLNEEQAYHFYFKQGKKDKLLFFFNGGGACWNDHTCLTSLKVGDRPTYNPTLMSNNSPDNGGILDSTHEENPYRDWSMIFLPYCTGDIHIGSKNTVYHDQFGLVTGVPGAPVMVQHRGFDNFLAVRDWAKTKFSSKGNKPSLDKLLVSGSSAGGYGATLNFPYLASAFPKAEKALMSDGAAAVLTQDFLDTMFSAGSNWGTENTFASWVSGFDQFGTYNALTFNETLVTGIASYYKNVRIGQYSTAWDVVQTQFLNLMNNPDNPTLWGNIPLKTFCDWNKRMETSYALTASASNYRYYIGKGTVHTVLTDAFAHNIYYTESSAGGVQFTDWISALRNKKKVKWENLSCTDCEAPFDPALCSLL